MPLLIGLEKNTAVSLGIPFRPRHGKPTRGLDKVREVLKVVGEMAAKERPNAGGPGLEPSPLRPIGFEAKELSTEAPKLVRDIRWFHRSPLDRSSLGVAHHLS